MEHTMDKWTGKVALVTGASSGIGAAICKRLVTHGLIVAGLSRRKDLVLELAKNLENRPGKLFAVKADVTNEESIVSAFKWIEESLGHINILINNAGIFQSIHLTNSPTSEMKRVIDTNVIGLCSATREAAKQMMKHHINGHIIHVSSIAAHKSTCVEGGIYSASKHAVRALTESLRTELNSLKSQIKISSISPGATDTEMIRIAHRDEVNEMPKLNPDDVVEGIIYMLSTPPHVQVHELIIKPIGEDF